MWGTPEPRITYVIVKPCKNMYESAAKRAVLRGIMLSTLT